MRGGSTYVLALAVIILTCLPVAPLEGISCKDHVSHVWQVRSESTLKRLLAIRPGQHLPKRDGRYIAEIFRLRGGHEDIVQLERNDTARTASPEVRLGELEFEASPLGKEDDADKEEILLSDKILATEEVSFSVSDEENDEPTSSDEEPAGKEVREEEDTRLLMEKEIGDEGSRSRDPSRDARIDEVKAVSGKTSAVKVKKKVVDAADSECWVCGSRSAQECAMCGKARYCGTECQRCEHIHTIIVCCRRASILSRRVATCREHALCICVCVID
jgi:hypothetical protein